MRHMMVCKDKRPCFARVKKGKRKYECGILVYSSKDCKYTDEYRIGECPFCKPRMEVTKGKEYPLCDYDKWRWKQTDKQRLRQERKRRERDNAIGLKDEPEGRTERVPERKETT